MPSIEIKQSDCIEFLSGLDSCSIDLALYDPPYFMGNKPFVNEAKKYKRMVESWDNQCGSVDEYIQWCRGWLRETHRVLKPGGTILVFGSSHTAFDLHVEMRKLELDGDLAFKFKNFVIWDLTNAPPAFLAKKVGVYSRTTQYINFFTKGSKNNSFFAYDYLKDLNGGVQHRDIYRIPNEANSRRVGHPTQKPIRLIETLVRAHCPEDGKVVDCFSGSGTTAHACLNSGRHFIGCDASAEYVSISIKRISSIIENGDYSEDQKTAIRGQVEPRSSSGEDEVGFSISI